MATDSSPVLAACFGATPERPAVEALAASGFSLRFVESRRSLIAHLAVVRPSMVLLPAVDARRQAWTPIVQRILDRSPATRVMLLASPTASSHGWAAAMRAGADVIVFSSVSELRARLEGCAITSGLSESDVAAVKSLFGDFLPGVVHSLLLYCVEHANRALSADDIADAAQMSRRTLHRRLRDLGSLTPTELIDWGRLLCASILLWRQTGTLASVSTASGFRSPRGATAVAARLLGHSVQGIEDISPLKVSGALRRRVLRGQGT